MRLPLYRTLPLCLIWAIFTNCYAADWPTWRYDAQRTANAPDGIPTDLSLQWVRELASPSPAWPPDQYSIQFDLSYEPIVVGKLLYLPSNTNDSVTAYDTETGAERWRFYTDGPVRFAPTYSEGNLYLVSDDGCLYCLDAKTGEQKWWYRGGPSEDRVLGNKRLVSMWPARGAPVVHEGVVYFTASIWPFMGIFVHAVDAETGEKVWTNSGDGSTYITQPHSSPAFAGVAPQGYLLIANNRLLVPGSRSTPAAFSLSSGKQMFYEANHGKMTGGYAVAAGEGWFINHDILYEGAWGEMIERGKYATDLPVIDGNNLYSVVDGKVTARTVALKEETTTDRRGREKMEAKGWGDPLWSAENLTGLSKIHLKAGSRIYGSSADGTLAAIDLSDSQAAGNIVWNLKIGGKPFSMIAGDEKLFVVTEEGSLYCFGEGSGETKTHSDEKSLLARAVPTSDSAAEIIERTGVSEGYCLSFGLGDGSLLEGLIKNSGLHIVGIDSDANRVEELRKYWTATRDYGARMAVIHANPMEIPLPPYLASLIVAPDLESAGFSDTDGFVKKVFHSLRPYGGVACLRIPKDQIESFKKTVDDAGLEHAVVDTDGDWTLLKREGALPGSDDWTHQYADSANSVVSQDSLVKAPLGILWWGGTSNQGILPRHGHGPSEQVIDGRLFIEGPDMIRAVDVYTGRLLWETILPGVGKHYDNTGHQPGANALGSNYVSTHDGIYVNYGAEVVRLDPASGEILNRFETPEDADGKKHELGAINVHDDVLLVGVSPETFASDVDFHLEEFRKMEDDEKASVAKWVGEAIGESLSGEEFEAVSDSLTTLLGDPDLISKVPQDPALSLKTAEVRKNIESYLDSNANASESDLGLKKLNRDLLVACIPNIRAREQRVGGWIWSGVASGSLVAMDRYSGEVLWTKEAENSFIHNSLILADGKVFCIDRLPETEVEALKRRGKSPEKPFRLLVADMKTGEEIWETKENIFGTWLGYSEEHDLLIQAGRASRDMLPEPDDRLIAYKADSGEVVWDKETQYGGPIMLHGDTLITQEFALNLLTGEPKMRTHPLTGCEIPWTFARNYGCNSAVASEHLLTFRSAAGGFFDLSCDGGTGNIGGFRSGCTSNLIVANGVLNAPDYTRTCVCSYQLQSSLALVHMPDAEKWTFASYGREEGPIRSVGINLGAPGDRMAEDGKLWIDYPSVGGPSPEIPISTGASEEPRWFRKHASLLEDHEWDWVHASGAEGIQELKIGLDTEEAEEKNYTVRLHFAEPEDSAPGERVFNVDLQGQRVLEGFDPAKEAGTSNRGIVKEFKGVRVNGQLKVQLGKANPNSEEEPVLSGVEIEAEGW